MKVLLLHAFAWVNLPYTILLLVLLVYWFTVILGLFDMEIFDFDVEGEADGFFSGILNLGIVPFSIWASIFMFQAWLYSLLANAALSKVSAFAINGFLKFILLAIVIIPLSAIITKLITYPLKKAFNQKTLSKKDFVGMECEITSSKVNDNFGTAEIRIEGDVHIIDVRVKEEIKLFKGDKVLIFDYDSQEDLFFITTI